SLAPEAWQHAEQLVDLLLALTLRARTNGVGHARLDVPAQQELLDLLERALYRRDLEQDVDAVCLAVDHPLETLHLPLDPSEPTEGLGLRLLVDHLVYPQGVVSARAAPLSNHGRLDVEQGGLLPRGDRSATPGPRLGRPRLHPHGSGRLGAG